MEIMEYLLLGGSVCGALMTIIGLLTYIKKMIDSNHEKNKIESEKNKIKQDFMMMGIQSLLYFRICEQAKLYKKRGSMTRQEYKDLEYFFTSYSNLGGNGTAKKLFEECKLLPIEEEV